MLAATSSAGVLGGASLVHKYPEPQRFEVPRGRSVEYSRNHARSKRGFDLPLQILLGRLKSAFVCRGRSGPVEQFGPAYGVLIASRLVSGYRWKWPPRVHSQIEKSRTHDVQQIPERHEHQCTRRCWRYERLRRRSACDHMHRQFPDHFPRKLPSSGIFAGRSPHPTVRGSRVSRAGRGVRNQACADVAHGCTPPRPPRRFR